MGSSEEGGSIEGLHEAFKGVAEGCIPGIEGFCKVYIGNSSPIGPEFSTTHEPPDAWFIKDSFRWVDIKWVGLFKPHIAWLS